LLFHPAYPLIRLMKTLEDDVFGVLNLIDGVLKMFARFDYAQFDEIGFLLDVRQLIVYRIGSYLHIPGLLVRGKICLVAEALRFRSDTGFAFE
jgi:hypothetical protein